MKGLALLAFVTFAASAQTFSHDVAPLLYKRCVSCHRAGGVAPFPLVAYGDAAKRAKLIATVTAKRYMPPWLPSAPRFQHEMKLTPAEILCSRIGQPRARPREIRARLLRRPKFPRVGHSASPISKP